jgi:thiol:disulfide interchange protein
MFKRRFMQFMMMVAMSFGMLEAGFAQQTSASTIQQKLSALFSSQNEAELLEPEQAFRLKTAFKGSATLIAELLPAGGYYLYKDRIRFAIRDANGVVIKAVRLPAGEIKNDRTFGRMEVYKQPVRVEIALASTSKLKNFTLIASYQGCHEKTGVCYPPINKTLNVVLP